MSSTDIIALIVTIIGVASFATVVTVLFRNYIKSQIKEINLGNRDIEIIDLMIYERNPNVIKKRKAGNIAKNVISMKIIKKNVKNVIMIIIYLLIKLVKDVNIMLILNMVIALFVLIMKLIMNQVNAIVIQDMFLIIIKLVLIVEKVALIAF